MPFTYDDADLANSPKDQVRLLIGDTNKNDPILMDGEIRWVLSRYNNASMNAAIRCCEIIISKFSRQVDETVGQVKISFSQRAKAYKDTLADLRQRLATEDCSSYAGGISRTDKWTNEQNTDRVRPDFTKHMMENQNIAPWVTSVDYNLWLRFEG